MAFTVLTVLLIFLLRASQVVLVVKNLPANAGDLKDTCFIPETGRFPGGEHGNPLQLHQLFSLKEAASLP